MWLTKSRQNNLRRSTKSNLYVGQARWKLERAKPYLWLSTTTIGKTTTTSQQFMTCNLFLLPAKTHTHTFSTPSTISKRLPPVGHRRSYSLESRLHWRVLVVRIQKDRLTSCFSSVSWFTLTQNNKVMLCDYRVSAYAVFFNNQTSIYDSETHNELDVPQVRHWVRRNRWESCLSSGRVTV